MSNQNKQMRGLKSKYKSSTGEHKFPAFEPPLIDKIPAAYNWLLRKSKREAERGGRRGIEGGVVGGGGGGGDQKIIIEGRKSVSHVETNLGSVIAFLQVKVLVSDMPDFMQVHAFRCARTTFDSLEKFSSKHMAYNMKKEFDKVYGPAWHCIVGSSFGSFVTHSTGCFLYFSMEKLYILLFKTKIQKVME